MENIQQWDPFDGRIYSDDIGTNDFITAATTAIFATPYHQYNEDAINSSVLIGLIQDWDVTQARQSPTIFECGSNGIYVVSTGRVAGTMRFSRVMYNGSNLLYLMYAKQTGLQRSSARDRDVAGWVNNEKSIGFGINMRSSIFNKPFGVMLALKSVATQAGSGENTPAANGVGAFFLENAYINTHGMGASAGAPYLGEQLDVSFEGVYPVPMNTGDTDWPAKPGNAQAA